MDGRFDYDEVRVYAIGIVNELFLRGGQSGMKEKRTGGPLTKQDSDWKRFRSMSDRQIRLALASDPEARPTDAKFWQKARVVMPEAKKPITIRLDADLLEWLRKQKGYQTRINAVLRTYMESNLTLRRGR